MNNHSHSKLNSRSINFKITNNRVYGCDSVPLLELPKFVRQCVKSIEAPLVIQVPIRQNGLTSSGGEYCCHTNVEALIAKFGGHRLIGYLIEHGAHPLEHVLILSHSVWITPEGNAVDVTKKEGIQYDRFINKDRKFQYFVPVSTGETAIREIKCYRQNDGLSVFESFYFDEQRNQSRHLVGKIKRLPKIQKMIGKRSMVDVFGPQWKASTNPAVLFTKPSSSTGKMLHEIERRAA